MIGYLSGKILNVGEHSILLDVRDVGYEVFVGNAREQFNRDIGTKLVLWVHTYAREDQITLFGFKEPVQKKVFLILIGISGIGPKLAMSVVTQLSPTELVDAVTMGNVKLLRSVPGVGQKMADRMILELKDKLGALLKEHEWAALAGEGPTAVWRDLTDALSGLGFSDQKIRNVITLLRQELGAETPEINQLLKLALQKMKH